MCGINGIYSAKGVDAREIDWVKSMNFACRHRGPDDEGLFIGNQMIMGHRRLAIIDPTDAGHQPMASFDKRFQIVYNGAIYNYEEIRKQLSSYPFLSKSDTEVVLAAYAKWGINCLKRLNGMFAFAVWDSMKQELFIARDRLGIKPLYYLSMGDLFCFSSELRALVSIGIIKPQISYVSLVDYLRYQTVHAPNTLLEGIYMLQPGHFLYMSKSGLQINSYWDLKQKKQFISPDKSYDEIANTVNIKILESVEKRLVADVPYGAFLSGGIDSSSIVAVMRTVSTATVNTFSVTFNEAKYNEKKYAELIASKYKTNHFELRLLPQDLLDLLPQAIGAMDHPSGDGINTYVISNAAKQAGVKMALSGLGGDELFAGYDIFKRMYRLNFLQLLNLIPKSLRTIIGSILQLTRKSIAAEKVSNLMATDKIDFKSVYTLTRQVLLDERIFQLIKFKDKFEKSVSVIASDIQSLYSDNYKVSTTSVAEIYTYLQNILLRDTDQMSMAHALEVRVPFLDHELVEFVVSLPDKFKYPCSPKKLLTDAIGSLLPDEIVNRPKMGFVFPWQQWLQNELFDFSKTSMINLAQREFFEFDAVMDLWNRFQSNDPQIGWSRVWPLIVLEHWMENIHIQ